MIIQYVKKKWNPTTKPIKFISLIVWDEASINHKNYFNIIDKLLKDILAIDDSDAN